MFSQLFAVGKTPATQYKPLYTCCQPGPAPWAGLREHTAVTALTGWAGRTTAVPGAGLGFDGT